MAMIKALCSPVPFPASDTSTGSTLSKADSIHQPIINSSPSVSQATTTRHPRTLLEVDTPWSSIRASQEASHLAGKTPKSLSVITTDDVPSDSSPKQSLETPSPTIHIGLNECKSHSSCAQVVIMSGDYPYDPNNEEDENIDEQASYFPPPVPLYTTSPQAAYPAYAMALHMPAYGQQNYSINAQQITAQQQQYTVPPPAMPPTTWSGQVPFMPQQQARLNPNFYGMQNYQPHNSSPFPSYNSNMQPMFTPVPIAGPSTAYLSPAIAGPSQPRLQREASITSRASRASSLSYNTDNSRSNSPNAAEMAKWGTRNPDGTWSCHYSGCTSNVTYTRGCDFRKHYKRHTKTLFCRYEGCPQSTRGGFSSKKDRLRHESSHNPNVPCEWAGCEKVFSRVDNMKDHVKRVHLKYVGGDYAA